MEYKANIMMANVGADDAKNAISYFVTDVGPTEDAEEIIEEFDKIVKKHGGVRKESKKEES